MSHACLPWSRKDQVVAGRACFMPTLALIRIYVHMAMHSTSFGQTSSWSARKSQGPRGTAAQARRRGALGALACQALLLPIWHTETSTTIRYSEGLMLGEWRPKAAIDYGILAFLRSWACSILASSWPPPWWRKMTRNYPFYLCKINSPHLWSHWGCSRAGCLSATH